MSGATVVRQRGKHYQLTLATPSISFAFEPGHRPGGGPTHEQDFHASAERRFAAELAPLAGALDDALDTLALRHPGIVLVPLIDSLPEVVARAEWSVKRFLTDGQRPCRAQWPLGTPAQPAAPPLDFATIELGFQRLPQGETFDRFAADLAACVDAIRARHHRAEAETARRSVPLAGAFHYLCGPGGIEDLNGAAGGGPLPGATPARAALELAAALCALIAAAEADGVVHAELVPDCLRVGAHGVALQGFGTSLRETPSLAPEGRSDFHVATVVPTDWTLRQRWFLGLVCRELTASHDGARSLVSGLMAATPGQRASPVAAQQGFTHLARDAAGPGLTAWLELTAPLDFTRRPSHIPARLALGSRGILQPCAVCGRPALLGASRDLPGPKGYRPDCCWRVRDRRVVRAMVGFLVLAALGGVAALWHYIAR